MQDLGDLSPTGDGHSRHGYREPETFAAMPLQLASHQHKASTHLLQDEGKVKVTLSPSTENLNVMKMHVIHQLIQTHMREEEVNLDLRTFNFRLSMRDLPFLVVLEENGESDLTQITVFKGVMLPAGV